MKESELMRKLHNGDKEAAGLIIERYYADIYRFCLYMVQSKEDAYDITQESFLKFIKYGTFIIIKTSKDIFDDCKKPLF